MEEDSKKGLKKTMPELHRLTATDQRVTIPVEVVLDNVRSEMNVGSIFRTADALGVAHLHLCGITAQPPSPEIRKTALGAEEVVPYTYYSATAECVDQLRSRGVKICSLEQVHGSISLQRLVVDDLQADRGIAIVLGHEVRGVDQAIVDASDYCIEIPQVGTKHSLNVANSAAIVLWEIFRQLTTK